MFNNCKFAIQKTIQHIHFCLIRWWNETLHDIKSMLKSVDIEFRQLYPKRLEAKLRKYAYRFPTPR